MFLVHSFILSFFFLILAPRGINSSTCMVIWEIDRVLILWSNSVDWYCYYVNIFWGVFFFYSGSLLPFPGFLWLYHIFPSLSDSGKQPMLWNPLMIHLKKIPMMLLFCPFWIFFFIHNQICDCLYCLPLVLNSFFAFFLPDFGII